MLCLSSEGLKALNDFNNAKQILLLIDVYARASPK